MEGDNYQLILFMCLSETNSSKSNPEVKKQAKVLDKTALDSFVEDLVAEEEEKQNTSKR